MNSLLSITCCFLLLLLAAVLFLVLIQLLNIVDKLTAALFSMQAVDAAADVAAVCARQCCVDGAG